MSLFISFEGIDGCGKSTQLELLRARLENLGHEVVATREPGGTALADTIRNYLLHATHPLTPRGELLLFGAARAQHVVEVIQPALERGAIVLTDRYADSSMAYQGGGLGLERDFIARMNAFATGGLEPDVTFLLDLDPAAGRERRMAQRGTDRIEDRGLEFQQQVRTAFLFIARADPHRVVVIDGSAPAKVVHNRIFNELKERRLLDPERLLKSDDDAEVPPEEGLILGAMLDDPVHIAPLRAIVTADHFHLARHRYVFEAIVTLHDCGATVDLNAVAEELRRRAQLAQAGGIAYLNLLSNLPHDDDPTTHAHVLSGPQT